MQAPQRGIDATFIIVLAVGLVGTAAFALGLLASLDDYSSVHPSLANPVVRVGMMATGALAMAFEARFIIGWARGRHQGS